MLQQAEMAKALQSMQAIKSMGNESADLQAAVDSFQSVLATDTDALIQSVEDSTLALFDAVLDEAEGVASDDAEESLPPDQAPAR